MNDAFTPPGAAWETVHMSMAVDIAAIRDALRRVMERKGVKPTTLSLQVGTNRTLVKNLLESGQDGQISTLVKLAGALDVDIEELLARPGVSIGGAIGAGGEVLFEDYDAEGGANEIVPRPPGISGDLVALTVRGASMLPKYKDGDIIYIRRSVDGVLRDYLGEDCAVRVKSGGTYVKQLAPGTRPGVFTLRSLNAEDMVDQEVEWATPILFIMPARARRELR